MASMSANKEDASATIKMSNNTKDSPPVHEDDAMPSRGGSGSKKVSLPPPLRAECPEDFFDTIPLPPPLRASDANEPLPGAYALVSIVPDPRRVVLQADSRRDDRAANRESLDGSTLEEGLAQAMPVAAPTQRAQPVRS